MTILTCLVVVVLDDARPAAVGGDPSPVELGGEVDGVGFNRG